MYNQKNTIKQRIVLAASGILTAALLMSGCSDPNADRAAADTSTGTEGASYTSSFLTGKGTKEEPFQIGTVEDLQNFAADVNTGNTYTGQYVALANDLDLSTVDNWTMIGTVDGSYAFAGVFDGAGHAIANLTCKNDQFAGLFALLNGTVANLRIENGAIEAATCGSFAAVTSDSAVIANCYTDALANGDTAGGIAGTGTGTYINCSNMAADEQGAQAIAGNKDGATLMNCYTNRGGSFELENYTNAEVEHQNQARATQHLNNMLSELSVKYDIANWYTWKLDEADTRPVAFQDQAVLISGVTKADGTAAEYDVTEHAWAFPILKTEQEKTVTYTVQFTDGSTKEITCDGAFEKIYYTANGIETVILSRQDETPDSDDIIFADTEVVAIDLGAQVETPQSDAVEFIPVAYIGEDGTVNGDNTLVRIAQPGKYTLTGAMNGQLLVDLGEGAITDGNKQAELELNQVTIQNTYGPGIKIENVLETGDTDYAGIRLNLADGTENTVDGSNSMNIYGDGDASEGAISTKMTMSIKGNTGKLNVIADLEGIESQTRLRVEGGSYDINSAEDGINLSDKMEIFDCYMVVHAGDDVVDSDGEMNINATLIGHTSVEHFFNARDGVDIDGVFIVGTSPYNNACKDGSTQGLVDVEAKGFYTKGQKILVADEQDNPLFAFEVQGTADNMVFSYPDMIGQTVHIYECSSVTGTFTDGVCREVTAFEKKNTLTHDGGTDTFAIADLDNQFVLDAVDAVME